MIDTFTIESKEEREKSFKIITDKFNLFTKNRKDFEILQVGQTYNIEYYESQYKDRFGKDRTSCWIKLIGAAVHQPKNPDTDKPDWDAIAAGKIRSLLVQALVQNRGIKELTESDKKILDDYVNYCMNGTKESDEISDEEVELDMDKISKEVK